VSEGDCDFIREVLAKEKKWGIFGNRIAAIYGLHKGIGSYTNGIDSNGGYSNLMPSSRGPIDLDWYMTLSAWGPLTVTPPGSIYGHATYIGAKLLWEGVQKIPYFREGIYRPEGLYSDPGEIVAASAYAAGATFADLFDKAWLDKYCKDK
jgi:hypothetical protein